MGLRDHDNNLIRDFTHRIRSLSIIGRIESFSSSIERSDSKRLITYRYKSYQLPKRSTIQLNAETVNNFQTHYRT
jgi:hypothetical protein